MKKVYILMIMIIMFSLSGCSILQKQDLVSEEGSAYSNMGECFEDINGCAVIFQKHNDQFYFYNEDMVHVRVSPYSTFKIMATLIGLQNAVIKDEQSTMHYNATEYPLNVWNNN